MPEFKYSSPPKHGYNMGIGKIPEYMSDPIKIIKKIVFDNGDKVPYKLFWVN